jgi:hypothetical protein
MTKLAVEQKYFQKLFQSIASVDLNVMEMSNPCPLCRVHCLACLSPHPMFRMGKAETTAQYIAQTTSRDETLHEISQEIPGNLCMNEIPHGMTLYAIEWEVKLKTSHFLHRNL